MVQLTKEATTPTTQDEAISTDKMLTKQSGQILEYVTRIDKSAKIVKHEKQQIKSNSTLLLKDVLSIIKTDNSKLDGYNPTYSGMNHYYLKVQSTLATAPELEKSTEKIVKAILNTCLQAPKVNFSNFVETLKDLETFNRYQDNMRPSDLGDNKAFMARAEEISRAVHFIQAYNDKESIQNINKDLRRALAKVPFNIEGISETSWNEFIKAYKVKGELLNMFIVALADARALVIQSQTQDTSAEKIA